MRAIRFWSALFSAALVLELLAYAVARGADMESCHSFANRGSAAALRQLLEFPFIDVSAGRYLYRKAYSFCLLQDDVPPLVFTPEEQPIVDGLPEPRPRPEVPPGSLPATATAGDPPDPAPDMTAAWAKCARSHPRGWNATTHTITKYVSRHWIRVPCP